MISRNRKRFAVVKVLLSIERFAAEVTPMFKGTVMNLNMESIKLKIYGKEDSFLEQFE